MKIGLLSDIHEDILSLQKALNLLSKEKCDTIICLGDIVGFALPFFRYIETRDAEECVRLVRENCSVVVAGNHDLYAVRKVPENRSGFDYGKDWYSLDYETRSKKARNKIWLYEDNELKSILSDSAKEFLFTLPEFKLTQFNDVKIFFSHFCFPDFSGSSIYFPSSNSHLQKHFDFIKKHDSNLSFSGHGHPEGIMFVDIEKFSTLKFGSYNLDNTPIWVVIPCVARTTRSNGVLVFDTEIMQIKSVHLDNH